MNKNINVSMSGGGRCYSAFQYGAFVLLLLFLAIPITADGQSLSLNQRIETGEVVTRDSWIVRTSRRIGYDSYNPPQWIQFTRGGDATDADIDLPSPLRCYVSQGGWCFFRSPSFRVKHVSGCNFTNGYKKVHLKVQSSNIGITEGDWRLTIYEGETKNGCTCPPDDMVSDPAWYRNCDNATHDYYSPAPNHNDW